MLYLFIYFPAILCIYAKETLRHHTGLQAVNQQPFDPKSQNPKRGGEGKEEKERERETEKGSKRKGKALILLSLL